MTKTQTSQEDIISEFQMLGHDLEMTLQYLMELGEKLPEMDLSEKTDENLVKGCQSKVWLLAKWQEGKIKFTGDSNTAITKGLVSLLIRVFDLLTPQEILDTHIFFPAQIGMDRFIGTQRSNGFAAMIQQIRRYAIAFKTLHPTT